MCYTLENGGNKMSFKSLNLAVKQGIILFFIFALNLFSQDNKPQVITNDYTELKVYFEQLLQNSKHNGGGEDNNWIHRWLWNNRFNFTPDGNFVLQEIDPAVLIKEQQKKNSNNSTLSESGWVPVGPIAFPPTYEPRSCYAMGRVNCIAFHPKNANIFWIGTPNGGIWKTLDAGKTWMPLGDNLTTPCINHIAVDPKNPDILYAATGDFDGSSSGINNEGIVKSTDGGMTWTVTSLVTEKNFKYSLLKKVIINPENTNILVTAGRNGIWKSTDAGENWLFVCDSLVTDLEMNPSDTRVLYAAMGRQGNRGSAGILSTSSFGDKWYEMKTGIPPKGNISRMDIAVSQANPRYLYVINVNSNNNGLHSFYQSTNAGNNWILKYEVDSNDNVLGAWGGDQSDRGGQGWYDLALIADPFNKEKVYAGGINIWMTENGGSDWEQASFWIYVFGESLHADQHYAAYNPMDKCIYFCNDGGVYRTKEIKPGSKKWIIDWIDKYTENIKSGSPDFKYPTVWENLNDGLAITEFYRMSLCRNKSNILAGGSQDNSCFYYNEGEWLNYIPNYDGMETMIDNDNPDIFYGVWQNGGLCKTTDGGRTLKYRLADTIDKVENGNWVTPVAMDPLNSEVIYIGYRNLWRSLNGGEQWEKVLDFDSQPDTTKSTRSLSIIKTSNNNSDYISVFKENGSYKDSTGKQRRANGELWITEDGCQTWKKSTNGLPLDSVNIVSIDYDNQDPKKMWVACYSSYKNVNTYQTTDAGETWTDISKPLPSSILINCIVHQPESQADMLYIGTNRGVYYTDGNMAEWLPYNENLPNTKVTDLEIQTSTNELFAATYGRGVWKTNTLPNKVEENAATKAEITVYPNPTPGEFNLNISYAEPLANNDLRLRISDIIGRPVYEESIFADSNPIIKSIKPNLQSGVYFVQVMINGRNYSARLVVGR
jgi:photosystem II stability/assembly factor-like uncharacterized protein